ncbi:MAG: recombinational DNA repair protein RecR [Sulfurimonas sp.]|jgi:recombinational DNA repair protein RecR
MDKYKVNRVDGKDNTNEKYIVIRVDTATKLASINRKHIKEYAQSIKYKDNIQSKKILSFIESLEKEEEPCSHCNGVGKFEVDAVCSTFSKDCDFCNGSGIIKKISKD